jgi:hypothetical protein
VFDINNQRLFSASSSSIVNRFALPGTGDEENRKLSLIISSG